MTIRNRYFLLAFVICIFLGFAPILVLFVKGQLPDTKSGRLLNTGLISLYVEPEEVLVTVDGELVSGESPFSARFVPVGVRTVEIQVPGFKTWKKQLLVEAGRVTRVGTSARPLRLIKDSLPQAILGNVLDYELLGNARVAILKMGEFTAVSSKDLSPLSSFKVPKAAADFYSNQSADKFVLAGDSQYWILDSDTGRVSEGYDLKGEIFGLIGNELVRLNQGRIEILNVETKQQRQIAENCLSVFLSGDMVYALKATEGEKEMQVVAGSLYEDALVPLIDGLPRASNASIYVTAERQILILSGNNLFRVDSGLTSIASGVTGVKLFNSGLIFTASSELKFYAGGSQKTYFVLRSGEKIAEAVPAVLLDQVFTVAAGVLTGFELDNRDYQQLHRLTPVQELRKLDISEDNKRLYWLEGSNFMRITLLD